MSVAKTSASANQRVSSVTGIPEPNIPLGPPRHHSAIRWRKQFLDDLRTAEGITMCMDLELGIRMLQSIPAGSELDSIQPSFLAEPPADIEAGKVHTAEKSRRRGERVRAGQG